MTDPRLARPLWRGRSNVDALTIACVEHAEDIMRRRHPDIAHEFVITQGSYQGGSGDPNSAGTHDLGGVVDIRWCGHDACLFALREAGMAAWHRTPAQGPWPHHIHAVVIGHPLLSLGARAQLISYFAGRNGLNNQARDDGPRLDPIPRPVWPWPIDWTDMATKEELRAELEASEDRIVTKLLKALVDGDPKTTVEKALRESADAARIIKSQEEKQA